MDHFLVDNMPVWVWRGALTAEECRDLREDPKWPNVSQQIYQQPERARELGALFLSRMVDAPNLPPIEGWTPHVTYTRSYVPINWHRDAPRGSSFKAYVYLNDAPGTIFSRIAQREVAGEEGTLVFFDIRIEHRGADTVKYVRKQVLGLRPLSRA